MAAQVRDRYAVARAALAQIAHPVAIVAAAVGHERSCATGTVTYVSHDPPLVATALHPDSRTARLARASGAFSVSILTASQQDVAEAAATPARSADKFAELRIPPLEAPDTSSPAPGSAGLPAGVAGSIAVLWCAVRDERPAGDHTLFVGEVVAHQVDQSRFTALLRYKRRYARLGTFQSGEAPEGYPT
jgi:flavin reductase (DIM6/NTAB) family NADH-FMN oxidoreductase RutF